MNALQLTKDISTEWMNHFSRFAKLNRMLVSPPQIKTGQTPGEIVHRRHKVKLIRYRPSAEKTYETPLLITYAMVNKPYIMDLLPGRSIIRLLLDRGFDVFLIDWGSPTESDLDKGLDVYINDYMDTMVNKTLALTGAETLNLLGYCMGGTMSLIYAALNQEKLKNLILMATPFDCSTGDGLLFKWAKDMPVEEIAGIYGNCPGWLLATSFLALNPMGTADKAMSFYKGMLDDSFVELFLAMEKWINDTVPVPGQAYTEFMKGCFQQNSLCCDQYEIGGRKVDLKNIVTPFLNLIAEDDTSVPPSASRDIGRHISSTDTETMSCKAGHIGLAVSGKALKSFWPKAIDWMATRSGSLVEAQQEKGEKQ
jgi:polyhydroxyalkanoate synthase subunit PhaC